MKTTHPFIGLGMAAMKFCEELSSISVDEAIKYALGFDGEHFTPWGIDTSGLTDHDRRKYGLQIEAAQYALEAYRFAHDNPGTRLDLILARALKTKRPGSGIRAKELIGNEIYSPRYRSGIAAIDRMTDGGCYGVTSLGGDPGTMKSVMAMRAALNAAADGWRCILYDTELGDSLFRIRLAAALNDQPKARPFVRPDLFKPADTRDLTPRINFRDIEKVTNLEILIEDARSFLEPYDDKVLIVMDSVSKIAKRMSKESYTGRFQVLEKIFEFAEDARKQSGGHVAFLLVCELNRAGGVAGFDAEYTADLDIRFRKSKTRGITEVSVQKSRESADGWLGNYVRIWERCKLIPEQGEDPEIDQEEPPLEMF